MTYKNSKRNTVKTYGDNDNTFNNAIVCKHYNEFIIYLEKYLGKKVYFEIAHKDMDLSRLLLNHDYELIIEDSDKYDLSKTFLMRRK